MLDTFNTRHCEPFLRGQCNKFWSYFRLTWGTRVFRGEVLKYYSCIGDESVTPDSPLPSLTVSPVVTWFLSVGECTECDLTCRVGGNVSPRWLLHTPVYTLKTLLKGTVRHHGRVGRETDKRSTYVSRDPRSTLSPRGVTFLVPRDSVIHRPVETLNVT